MNDQLPEVTEKDKKQDILSAYYSLLEKLQKDGGPTAETANNLSKMAVNLKTSTRDQIKSLSDALTINIDETTASLESLAASLGKLQEIKDSEESKLRQEKDNVKKLWAREQEEHDYQTKREHAQENDAWVAEKQKREAVLAEREAKLKESEIELGDLRNKDKTFEARLGKEVLTAVSEVTVKLQSEQAHKEALEATRREAEKQLLGSKIEGLVNQVSAQQSEITRLNAQVDASSSRLTDIATNAVRTYKINSVGKENADQ